MGSPFLLMIFYRMSLDCKLVPVQYREYEYGLLTQPRFLGLYPGNEVATDQHPLQVEYSTNSSSLFMLHKLAQRSLWNTRFFATM